jgi:ATP-dependent exoDNAse (exonuclease V) alpha subunit
MRVANTEQLIDNIYPGVDSDPPPSADYFTNRMILSPRNADVAAMNEEILDLMDGEPREFFSADTVITEDGADPADEPPVSEEFMRSITSSSLPPGILRLKVGCPIICLRNLDPSRGLCNGTRLIVTSVHTRVLEAEIIGGDYDGQSVLIPRISLIPSEKHSDVTFNFRRLQFPVRLAFSLSINKAQGQTVRYVGLDLREPVFSHGQLYVALSRVTTLSNVKILLPDDAQECAVDNIVYPEVLM